MGKYIRNIVRKNYAYAKINDKTLVFRELATSGSAKDSAVLLLDLINN